MSIFFRILRLARYKKSYTNCVTPKHTHFNKEVVFGGIVNKKKKFAKRFFNDALALMGIFLLTLFGVWYGVLKNSYFSLGKQEINQLIYIPQENVLRAINNYYQEKFFGVIPKNNYVTFRSEDFKKKLAEKLSQFAAVENISVKKIFPNTIIINITERIPAIIWVTASDPQAKNENKTKYIVDRKGIVTQKIENTEQEKGEIFDRLPEIHDENRTKIEMGWPLVSPQYLSQTLSLEEKINSRTELTIKYFILPKVDCTIRQYTSQNILDEAALDSFTQEFKEKKRGIQNQFKKGLLSLDESIDALERLKQEEMSAINSGDTAEVKKLKKWLPVDVAMGCDLVKVARDVAVVTKLNDKEKTFKIYLDTKNNFEKQLDHLKIFLLNKKDTVSSLEYIDLRFDDRLYYK